MVVVDVDDERGGVEHLGVGAEPALVRAVERQQDTRRGIVGHGAPKIVERHPRVLARQRRLAGQVHDRVLAERVERQLRGQQRPERVSVRVLVRRDEKAVVRADRLGDRMRSVALLCSVGSTGHFRRTTGKPAPS